VKHLIVALVAIVAIAILAYTALRMDIDSGVLAGSIATIGGIAGYRIRMLREARIAKTKTDS